MDVVRDPDLTLNEKRAILASWASDACALEAAPGLRETIRWDDIMDALGSLDQDHGKPLPHYKRVLTRKDAGVLGGRRFRWRNRNDQGASLN
jgi:hypothetical protein